jgi:quercetin dioxygenase-like cupin family protein
MSQLPVTRQAQLEIQREAWGHLVWQVSGGLGNSDALTIGRCVLAPGAANPRHHHPNCDEVLEVLAGAIVHTLGEEEIAMGRGDMITIPAGVAHNARNVGGGVAELRVCFSSAWRETVIER